jgi:RNA-binding protein with serine-rich domain 1
MDEGNDLKLKSEDTSLQVSNLTRNVTIEHLKEIFGFYGVVNEVYIDDAFRSARKGATIVFNSEKEAQQALFYLDGGKIDGSIIKVSFVLVNSKRKEREQEVGGFFCFYRTYCYFHINNLS